MTTVQEWQDGKVQQSLDYLVAEEPLEIRVNGHPLSVTMRTPGNDLELAAGFLLTEGIIRDRNQIERLEHASHDGQQTKNTVEVVLAADAEFDRESLQRNFFVASSCGICGKTSIDAIRVRGIRSPNPAFRIAPETLCVIPDRLREAQPIFSRTGGLHGAALFNSDGELIEVREDVGRHNAVDKLIGWTSAESRAGSGQLHDVSQRPRRLRNRSESSGRGRAASGIRFRAFELGREISSRVPFNPRWIFAWQAFCSVRGRRSPELGSFGSTSY